MRAPRSDFRVRAADDPPSLLVVIFDAAALSWAELAGDRAATTVQSVTEQMLVFLNSFILLHESNRVCVILASPSGAELVYPKLQGPGSRCSDLHLVAEDNALDAAVGGSGFILHGEQAPFQIRDAVLTGVKNAFEAQEGDILNSPASISTALATALCLHNRARCIKKERSATGQGNGQFNSDSGPWNGRTLMIVASEDVPEQYVPIMNCIFSAQRMGVSLDSCVLSGKDSTYLQQAAYLTNGVCLRPNEFSSNDTSALVQILQTVFLTDRLSRDFLAMPTPEKVDFRASCMMTRQIIDVGYTCSVCLSTFATSVGKGAAMCPICSARFAITSKARRRPPRP